MVKKIKIGFFGDGQWAYNSAKNLLKNKFIKINFFCLRANTPDKKLIKLANRSNIKCFNFKNINMLNNVKKIKDFSSDLLVSVSYDQIFKKKIIECCNLGIINCHCGALPFYRGRSPINWAIINGEKSFGITVHYVNQKIDQGDIIIQKKYPIKKKDDFKSLLNLANKKIPYLLLSSINLILKNNVKPIRQSSISKIGSYYKKRTNGDEDINWNQSSIKIFNFIRALCRPGVVARTYYGNKIIKINKTYEKFIKNNKNIKPGTVTSVTKKFFIVKTFDSAIKIKEWNGNVKKGYLLK